MTTKARGQASHPAQRRQRHHSANVGQRLRNGLRSLAKLAGAVPKRVVATLGGGGACLTILLTIYPIPPHSQPKELPVAVSTFPSAVSDLPGFFSFRNQLGEYTAFYLPKAYEPGPGAQSTLDHVATLLKSDGLAAWLSANPGYFVVIEGSADYYTEARLPGDMGLQRADAARAYLIAHDVKLGERLLSQSIGASGTVGDAAKHRAITFRLLKNPGGQIHPGARSTALT